MNVDIDEITKAAFGGIAAFLAAILGAWTRHVYMPDGFKWRRAMWDVPVAAFCGIFATGLGNYLRLDATVVSAMSGAIAFLGPNALREYLSSVMSKATSKTEGESGNAGKNTP